MSPPVTDRKSMALFFGFAAFAVGQAVQASNGNLHPVSIRWLTAAIVACLVGVTLPTWSTLEAWAERLFGALATAGLAWQFFELLKLEPPPGMYLHAQGIGSFRDFFLGLAAAAVLCGLALSEKPPLEKALPYLLVAAFLFVGAWMIRTSPAPFIDVYVFQKEASVELLAGKNPYAMTYPDIYGNSPFYGEGLSVNGRLQFGFPYFPLSLLLALPGHVLGGDYRYAQIAASALGALFLMLARPGRLSRVAAALYLFTPRAFFVVEQGWTDPFVFFGLGATVFTAVRFPKALPYVLGLFLSVKQYLVFAAPAVWLLLPRPIEPKQALRFVGKVIATGAAVTLPFALWDFKAFWHSVVALQTLQPFRTEALSYLAWWHSQGHDKPSTAWAFVMACVGLGVGLWRLPRTPAGYAACCVLAYILFFAFNKQAFCNYYAFVIGACVLAAGGVRVDEPPAARA